MLKRVLAGTAVAAVSLMPAATAAQARAASPAPGPGPAANRLPHTTVVNLHHAYLAHLGHTKAAKIAGIVYARGKKPRGATPHTSCSEPNCPLTDNGGPVQHSPHVYLLLWGPHWRSDPSQAASAAYLERFYGGLGAEPQDNWSTINSLYGDGGYPAFTGSVYEGAFQDTSIPPAGVHQNQLAAEADAFAGDHGITHLTNAQIVVATQAGTCPDGFFAPNCNGGTGDYCAWHSNSGEPYTNLPYILDAGAGCGADLVVPNRYDGFSIVGGHEYAETITDPFPLSGWWDPNDPFGGEIGDKCAWRDPVTGKVDIGAVTLSTGTFAMQPLYDNNALANGGDGCVLKPIGALKGFRNLCLDNSAGLGVNGNPVDIRLCIGGSRQRWTQQNGELRVNGKCLADSTWAGAGTRLVIEACNGQRNQRWSYNTEGEYVLAFRGLCLTDPNGSTTNGTQVKVQTCVNAPDQRWSVP